MSFGATGERDASCHVLEISDHCDLSGIGHLVYGDLTVGGVLAIFFHYLAHKNGYKIEKTELELTKLLVQTKSKD